MTRGKVPAGDLILSSLQLFFPAQLRITRKDGTWESCRMNDACLFSSSPIFTVQRPGEQEG